MTVRIVADQDIAALDSAFGKLGELTLRPGRSICRADLMQADALVVRSTTSVNKDLLQGTPVRFVATATSGTDHVDRLYLQRAGIGFADAAGCNANAVVEYVVTALSLLERDRVVDLKIVFYDGKMHPVDSKDIAFQIAGYHAFKEAFLQASPCLLEPIHNIEVRIPEDSVGKVMGDLTSRRGRIQGMDSDAHYQIIKAQVPAGELYNYAGSLRSLTGGRGVHQEEFSHYEEIPKEAEKKVIEESKRRKEES